MVLHTFKKPSAAKDVWLHLEGAPSASIGTSALRYFLMIILSHAIQLTAILWVTANSQAMEGYRICS